MRRGCTALWVGAVLLLGCQEEFDPDTLVTEVRILGVAAEPADLAPGETTRIEALVASPDGVPVGYHWELCAITKGPDEAYECDNEALGLPEELLPLFDLGTAPTAQLSYFIDPDAVQEACRAARDDVEELGAFVELPNCDEGYEVTLRLSISFEGREKVAIKRLFLWFETPEESERNHNPQIETIRVGIVDTDPEDLIGISPGGRTEFTVVVDDSAHETFTPEYEGDEVDEGERREEILFSFFSTAGEFDDEVTFTDEGRTELEEAGQNAINLSQNAVAGQEIEVFVVIRDGRGGADWTTRTFRIVVPGGQVLP